MYTARVSLMYEIAAMIEIANEKGVCRRNAVKAEKTRSGAVIWFINGNKVSRMDAERRIEDDLSFDESPRLAPVWGGKDTNG